MTAYGYENGNEMFIFRSHLYVHAPRAFSGSTTAKLLHFSAASSACSTEPNSKKNWVDGACLEPYPHVLNMRLRALKCYSQAKN